MPKHAVFRMPNRVKISGRSSTITNSFVQALIPTIEPTDEEVSAALELLGIESDHLTCAYCGDTATEWDHLRPLVRNRRPTGFASEIGNLVPACGKCNQSKGNKPWRDWMQGPARLSPKSRQISDLEDRIRRLERFEEWRTPSPLDFESLGGTELWTRYWDQWTRALESLETSQVLADEIRAAILGNLAPRIDVTAKAGGSTLSTQYPKQGE